ncbi:uncharacterized protein LOC120084036 [Benincasa hispida]|uniref:uncharacterized protein LOC120084036 n=1 Tax=Benincasa hispida TaxID=102211 RepID=UPI001900C77B|nr:uncharacterized protein LOC120084036 [Benincasa hispida]
MSYRSHVCWDEVGERKFLGPELVKTMDEHMQIAQNRCKDFKFETGDKVLLKVAYMKGVLRFRKKKGKLSPRFIGPFEVLEQIGLIAYWLALSPSPSSVHNVFHVSMLRKYVADPSHVLDLKPIQLNENLSCDEKPI